MITNLIRKALAPTIETLLLEERETINDIIAGMENALDEMNLIRSSEIGDVIANSIDTYDLASRIAGDIAVDTYELASRIAGDIDTTGIADDVVSQVETTLEIQYQNMNNRFNDIEVKMDAILKHLGVNVSQ